MGFDLSEQLRKRLGVTKETATRQVRRFLSDAYGFLRGEATNGEYGDFGLEQALAARVNELDGTPRNPNKLNRLARIDRLLANVAQVSTFAQSFSEEDLSTDVLAGVSVGASGVSNVLSDALNELGVDSSQFPQGPPGEVTAAFDGNLDGKAKSLFQGDEFGLPDLDQLADIGKIPGADKVGLG